MLTSVKRRKAKGFTLIELLIVIAILGILMAIFTPVFIRARFKTYHAACVQNEHTIATALEVYSLENEHLYPTDITVLTTGSEPFLRDVPECPTAGIDYIGTYTVSADNKSYEITCPGFHEIQLPGMVQDTYPRVIDTVIYQYNADR